MVATETQLQVLAYIARGDTYKQISETTGLPIGTLQGIKERNKAALLVIQDKLIDHQVSTSKKLLSKAQGIIEHKLDRIASSQVTREKLNEQLKTGEIDFDEYKRETVGLIDATLAELNTVAKEAFVESQIEQGKPTSISATPQAQKDELLALAKAIESGDEVALERIVFNGSSETYLPEAING